MCYQQISHQSMYHCIMHNNIKLKIIYNMCEGGGYCLSLCECSYMKGTEDCNCIGGKHSHYKTDGYRFCRSLCSYECKIKKCKSWRYCGYGFPRMVLSTFKICKGR